MNALVYQPQISEVSGNQQSALPLSSLEDVLAFIRSLVEIGGPDNSDYRLMDNLFRMLGRFVHSEHCSPQHRARIIDAFAGGLSLDTIQGLGFHQPHGYAGDFEIIDRIYRNYESSNPKLAKWDRFVHQQPAFKAVKNRLSYFLNQIWNLHNQHLPEAHVLNLASGPGRDLYETFRVLGRCQIHVDCVDQDLDAIDYARALCQEFWEHLTFHHCNVLRFQPARQYQLIWSGGLFDYFNDKVFIRVMKRLIPFLAPDGKIVIGNFSEHNPTRGYMELFNWKLFHRSAEKLRSLAEACGVKRENITVEQEPEGVNLFLHVRAG